MNSICCGTYSVYKPTFKLIRLNISIRKKSRKLFGGRDLIVMKLKPQVLLAGSSTNSPLSSVFVHHRPKNCPSMTKIGSRHSLFESVYQIWGLYIIFEAINADIWLWPIFGCKVGQSVQIGMKLELGVWHHLLDVYAKFQTDISKHVQKVRKTFRWLGVLVTPPLQVFLSARGPKIAQSWRKSVGIKTLTT